MGNKEQKLAGVTFILARPNGEMLLQLRDEKSRYYPNTWCFPGEGAEGDEEPIQMVIRGVQEEYDIRVSKNACQFLTINHLPPIAQEITVFICKIDANQTPVMREGKEMRWMNIDEIEKIELGFEQNKFLPLVRRKLEEFLRLRQ